MPAPDLMSWPDPLLCPGRATGQDPLTALARVGVPECSWGGSWRRIWSDKLLRDTFQVFEILSFVHSPEVARAWLMGMHPELDDASPAEALSNGRSREVMALARSYIAAR